MQSSVTQYSSASLRFHPTAIYFEQEPPAIENSCETNATTERTQTWPKPKPARHAMLQCARCKSAWYCNQSCQKENWKAHKPSCAQNAQGGSKTSSGARTTQSFQPGEQHKKPFTAISNNKFLHDHSEEKTFQLLIDMLRLRQEDEYNLEGETMTGSIYNQEPNSEPAFRTLIRKAKAVPGLLPPWWDSQSLEKCLTYSRKTEQFSLACAQEKHDIQETWGDNNMPMKLRMVAEKIYGNTPGGTRSDAMLGLMMGMEGGANAGMHSTTLDIASLMNRKS